MEQKQSLLYEREVVNTLSLPNSYEIEKELLGQILMDNTIIDKIMHYIPSETVFYNEFHRSIWRGIEDLRRKGEDVIDLNSLIAEIPPDIHTKEIAYKISQLIDIVGTANHENNAKILYEKWLLRNVIIKSEKVKQVASVKNSDARSVLEQLHREIESILDMQIGDGFDIDGLLDETFEKMFSEDSLIRFGYPQLDELTGGMTRGEITVIAGRPGHFKSTTMLNVVRNLIHSGYKVLVMNREMSNVEMMKKLIVLEAEHLSYEKIRLGVLDESDNDILEKAKNKIRESYKNLVMYDNIFDIDGSMREIRKHSPDVVVDDYIGLVSVSGVEDNRLRIDNIMKQYKWAAKKNDMAVLLVSQLNRECETRANKRPLLRDLRDSGSIEQDAEIILFMYYEWRYYMQDSDMGEYGIEIILGKNRYGKSGSAKMGVAGDRCKIYSSPEEALTEAFNG
jgi:replicative DNA helicase|tara:strand:- start:157 stop:1509 length:1353 start_codon:yes stop_codon:yes gene_type:complete